jgi:WD40 repeat protein
MEMEMTLSGPEFGEDVTIPMRFQGDIVPPDSVQGAMTISVNDVDVETQVVMIGDQAYVLNPLTNQWQVSDQSSAAFNPEDLVMNPGDVEDLVLVGETIAEDTPVYHLTGRALLPFSFEDPLGEVKADMQVEYWIGIDDLRLVRSVVEGDIEFSGEIEASAAMSMTMYVFDYDAPIEIVAPEIPSTAEIDVPGVGAIPIEPSLLAPLAGDTPEGHIQRGLDSLAGGRLGLAVAHFDRALALQPGWPEALLYRGAAQAIDGDLQAAFADLDRAIAAEPERADAYALRAWAHLRSAFREEAALADALELARPDVSKALELDPELAAAQGLQATLETFAALDLYESDPDQAIEDFETAMAGLSEVMQETPDQAAGSYLALASTLFGLKAEEPGWLYRTVDQAEVQLADDPAYYPAYGNRGLARLVLGSQVAPSVQTLQGAGSDLLATIALLHTRIAELADPAGGPMQVAHIWDLQEGAYTAGTLYSQAFFGENPQLFPEFARMLTSYWELNDLMGEAIDDPIIFSVAFSPDGRQIATLSESGPSYLRIWDAESGEKQLGVELGLDGRVIATTLGNLAYSPDGRMIVVAYTNPVVRVLDAQSGEVLLELAHDQAIDSAAFSPDGATIATADSTAAAPVLWDAVSGEKLMTMTVESDVATVAFSPDGALLAGGGAQVHLWDVATGEIIATLPGDDMFYLAAPAFSPDGALLAVPGYPVRVVDVPGATEVYTIPLDAHTVAFSPDGSRLATAGVQAAGVWDATNGQMIFLAGHPRAVDAIAWIPDGSRLVTGGSDGRFRVWDAQTGAELWTALAVDLWWE